MPYRMVIECKLRVEDVERPYHYSKTTFGKMALVDLDPTQAAHELQETMNNLVIPYGRADFIRSLFESWGQSMSRVFIKWLAEQWEPEPTYAEVDDQAEWTL